MGGGGKGSAGKVEFAAYLEEVHEDWLGVSPASGDKVNNSIVEIMNSLWTIPGILNPNPYTDAEAYDPSSFIGEVLIQARKIASASGYLPDVSHVDRPSVALSEWEEILVAAQNVVDNTNTTLAAVDITNLITSIFSVAVSNATAAALQTVTDSKTHIDTIVDGAIDKALSVINSQPVKDSIAVFSESLEEETNLIKSRFSAGMAEANATMSSAFIFGNSNIENAKIKAIERFTTDLVNRLYNQVILSYISSAINLTAAETQTFNNLFNANLRGQVPFTMQARQARDTRLDASTQLINSMFYANIANDLAMPQMYNKIFGTSIIALSERDKEDVRYNAEEKMWDLKVYNAGVNILGGMNTGGAAFVPEGSSQTASTIAGALGGTLIGAKIGAEIGAAGGPIGVTAGAGIGLVLGAIAGAN